MFRPHVWLRLKKLRHAIRLLGPQNHTRLHHEIGTNSLRDSVDAAIISMISTFYLALDHINETECCVYKHRRRRQFFGCCRIRDLTLVDIQMYPELSMDIRTSEYLCEYLWIRCKSIFFSIFTGFFSTIFGEKSCSVLFGKLRRARPGPLRNLRRPLSHMSSAGHTFVLGPARALLSMIST